MKRDSDIGNIEDEEIMALYHMNAGKPTLWMARALVRFGYSRAHDLLELHRRFHDKAGCPGAGQCYVCDAELSRRDETAEGEAK